MWWQNAKMKLIVVGILLLIAVIIFCAGACSDGCWRRWVLSAGQLGAGMQAVADVGAVRLALHRMRPRGGTQGHEQLAARLVRC